MARSKTISILGGLLVLCSPAVALGIGSGGPVNLAPPQIAGTPEVGQSLTCSQGSWGGAIDSYSYQWNRNGGAIGAATGTSYVVAGADAGQQITCTVTATDFSGSSAATSPPVTPTTGGSGSPPTSGPTQAPLPSPASVIQFPRDTKNKCASRRKFKIRIKQAAGVGYSSAAVFVNGKQVQVVKASRLIAPIDLRGLPKGSFVAKIVVTTSDGRTLTGSRKYRTCAKKRGPKGKKHRL